MFEDSIRHSFFYSLTSQTKRETLHKNYLEKKSLTSFKIFDSFEGFSKLASSNIISKKSIREIRVNNSRLLHLKRVIQTSKEIHHFADKNFAVTNVSTCITIDLLSSGI